MLIFQTSWLVRGSTHHQLIILLCQISNFFCKYICTADFVLFCRGHLGRRAQKEWLGIWDPRAPGWVYAFHSTSVVLCIIFEDKKCTHWETKVMNRVNSLIHATISQLYSFCGLFHLKLKAIIKNPILPIPKSYPSPFPKTTWLSQIARWPAVGFLFDSCNQAWSCQPHQSSFWW